MPGAAFQDVDDMTSASPFWQQLVTYRREYYLKDLTPNESKFIPTLSADWNEDTKKDQHQRLEIIDPTITLPSPNPSTNPQETILPDLINPDVHEPPPPIPNRRSNRIRRSNPRYYNDDMITKSTITTVEKHVSLTLLNNLFLQCLKWNPSNTASKDCLSFFQLLKKDINPDTGDMEYLHPFALQTMANAEDNPTLEEAMNGPFAEGFKQAMDKEWKTLNDDFQSWDIVDQDMSMNVLTSVWAFKIKRFPDGLLKKLKDRFCVRGLEQKEGIDFFDTYSPVVKWTTIRTMLVLTVLLELKSKQVDYTAAFLHAPVTEVIFVEMPRAYKIPGKVLKLKRSLYDLKQSPRNFFLHLKQGLLDQGFVQSTSDECLFLHSKIIALVYVDDCLFFSPNEQDILEMIKNLKLANHHFEIENDVAGYLGVSIVHHNNGSIELSQKGLIQRIITAAKLENATPKHTPSDTVPLPSDRSGTAYSETFNYASLIGMLIYLAGHTRPDIAYAVHQCARFTFAPKISHESALKRIVRYLIHTKDKGLILRPSKLLEIDLYVDSDFAGLWSVEDKTSPESVKSRTGFVLMLSGVPVLWFSKLQSEISLSTFEAEYIALSTAMRDLLPFRSLLQEISSSVGLSPTITATIHTRVWEDNAAAEKLAKLEPTQVTPRSKHFAVKYHWFWSKLSTSISILRVCLTENIGDIFTKGL